MYMFSNPVDDYKIVLNDDGLPRLRISNFLQGDHEGRPRQVPTKRRGKKYIKEKVQSATWLIKKYSAETKDIYRVAESIVSCQKDFFDGGIHILNHWF